MAVTTAVTDLIHSLGELLASVFGAAYTLVHTFIAGLWGLFSGFFAFAGNLAQGVIDLVGGVGKFVAGNIVVLGVVAAAGYFFVRFIQPQQQGRRPAAVTGAGAGKKTN